MSERPSTLPTDDEEINLTPLLDCIFILVFFFLVATTLREEEARLEVRLPQAAVEATQAPSEVVEIFITADGGIVVGGTTVDPEALEVSITAAIEGRHGDPVEVVSDAEAPMQAFVDVVTALSHLGISFTQIRLEPGESPVGEP